MGCNFSTYKPRDSEYERKRRSRARFRFYRRHPSLFNPPNSSNEKLTPEDLPRNSFEDESRTHEQQVAWDTLPSQRFASPMDVPINWNDIPEDRRIRRRSHVKRKSASSTISSRHSSVQSNLSVQQQPEPHFNPPRLFAPEPRRDRENFRRTFEFHDYGIEEQDDEENDFGEQNQSEVALWCMGTQGRNNEGLREKLRRGMARRSQGVDGVLKSKE